jgi:hypothetical protein
LLDGDLAFVPAQGHVGGEVAVEQRLHPRLQQSKPQLCPVGVVGLPLLAVLAGRDVLNQPRLM